MDCALLRGYGHDQAMPDLPQACKQSVHMQQDRKMGARPKILQWARLHTWMAT